MARLSVFFCLFGLFASSLLALPPPPQTERPATILDRDDVPRKKVSFPFVSRAQLAELEASGVFEILEVRNGRVTALQQDVPTQDTLLASLPVGLSVLSRNVDDELATFRAKGSEGAYHSVAETEAELKDYAARYPSLCRLESIGKTFEGRDIWALKVSGAPDTTKVPRILVFGLTHAREWITTEQVFYIIKKLVTGYASDEETKRLLNTRCLFAIPVLNPDGLEYSQSHYKMWRKNRSNRASGVGVDINRNFEIGWGKGSSASPGSDVYRGPNFNSEEETKALLELVKREKFHASISFHSYSELILYPWGYTTDDPPGKDTFVLHGKAMSEANGYDPGSVAQILYIAGGGSDDSLFARHGCWAWTFELGQAFVPAESEIEPICVKNYAAVLHLVKSLDDLAAKPPPISSAASITTRLAAVENVWRCSSPAILTRPSALDESGLDELMVALAGQTESDPALAQEIERRACDPTLRRLYAPLARVTRMGIRQ